MTPSSTDSIGSLLASDHGLPERTVAEISQCVHQLFPQLHWLKLYGSRAMAKMAQNGRCPCFLREKKDTRPSSIFVQVPFLSMR